MTARADRRARLAYELALNERRAAQDHGVNLPGVKAASLGDILQREAARPMRGGAADLQHSGLFGDGQRQRDLF